MFDDVHGIDVSPEMIAQSRTYLGGLPNVTTEVGDGGSLSPYRDGSFDFVFSYQVFQHIPDPDVIRRYVVEAGRVLRPGGVFKFLVKTRDWVGAPREGHLERRQRLGIRREWLGPGGGTRPPQRLQP